RAGGIQPAPGDPARSAARSARARPCRAQAAPSDAAARPRPGRHRALAGGGHRDMSGDDALAGIIAPAVIEDAGATRAGFLSATPFRHCVMEGFFVPAFADALLAQFPAFERGNALNEDGIASGKSTVERIRGLGEAYARLDACIRSPGFLGLVERMTGIDGLLY